MTRTTQTRNSRKRSRSYAKVFSPSLSGGDPDEEGSVKLRKGDRIRDKRYKVLKEAGRGTFGTVFEVWDSKWQEHVALKVVRSVPRYIDAAHVEVKILEKIREKDKKKVSRCVRLLGAFETRVSGRKHVCITFERLGISIYEFIKANKYRGFITSHCSQIGYQIAHAIEFCHSIGLTHTDLKPENVLLVDDTFKQTHHHRHGRDYRLPHAVHVRLIDFGGATFHDDHHSNMINTRQYRAPEVILGLGWDEKSDIWSIGCILAELYTGDLLFQTHEDIEHLALMEKILGKKLPQWMIKSGLSNFDLGKYRRRRKRSKRAGRSPSAIPLNDIFCETKFELKWPENASKQESIDHVNGTKILEKLIEAPQLTNCIRSCLVYDPAERISATKLKSHPFFEPSFAKDRESRYARKKRT